MPTPSNDRLADQAAACFGDDGLLALAVAVKIDHDPIVCSLQVVSARGIRGQEREMPGTALSVQDRQPSRAARIEPFRSDRRQESLLRLVAILVVDIEQLVDVGPGVAIRSCRRPTRTRQSFSDPKRSSDYGTISACMNIAGLSSDRLSPPAIDE